MMLKEEITVRTLLEKQFCQVLLKSLVIKERQEKFKIKYH